MKTNFWKFAAVLGLGLAAVVACEKQPEPSTESPVFPETVLEENVEAGATVEVSFDANLDWELSIPAAEQAKYWLDDAGVPASKVTGKAGQQTVSVVFSEDEYYDQNVVCEVTLTMGGQNKVIARLTRLALNRTIEVYVAEKTDWGFKNTYAAEKSTALELVTFVGDVTYSLPIKVVANYDWNLALPEWCEGAIEGAEALSGKAGQVVEVLLTGKLTEGVKDGADGVVKFFDAVGNSQALDLPLTLPAFADRVEWTEPASMSFDHTGVSAMPAIGYVLAMEGFVIRALEWDGQWHALTFADWVTVTPGEATEGLLQNVAVTLGVSENTGKDRVADLFLFPASMADAKVEDICNPNNCSEFNEPYAKYHIGRLTQAGVPMPYISEYTDAMMGVETYEASLSAYTENQWWSSMAGGVSVANQYELNYWHEWSELTMLFDSAFASYKIYDFDFNEVSADADFWLTFSAWAGNTKGKVTMDPAKFNNPYAEAPESFIVFYDEAGKVLAGVCCKYTSTGGGSSAATLSVVNGEATVETLPAESEIVQWLGSELSVSTVFAVNANSAETVFQFSQSIAMASALTTTLAPSSAVTLQTEGNYFGVSATESVEVIIVLKDANYMNLAAIYYTYTKPAGGGSSFEIVPTETLGLMTDYGDRVKLAVMETSNPAAEVLYNKYNTPNMWTLDCNNQGPIITFTQTIASIEVLDEEFNPSTVPFVQAMGTMAMIQAPTVKDITRVMLLKNATGNVMGVILYTFTF